MSPSIAYSTKRQLSQPVVKSMFHITDWMPTILDYAGYTGPLENPFDGVSQRVVFDQQPGDFKPPRNKFIYGLANYWDEQINEWTTHFAVRYGKWKYMNFRRELYGNYKCEEGWKNDQHLAYLIPNVKRRAKYAKMLNASAVEPFLPRPNSRNPGLSSYLRTFSSTCKHFSVFARVLTSFI